MELKLWCFLGFVLFMDDYGGICRLQNKKERKKVREVGILKKDPEQLKDQIQKLEIISKL